MSAVPVCRSIAGPLSRLSAVAVARPIAEPIADRLAATAIPITATVARPTTEPVADGLAASTATPISGRSTATIAGSIDPAVDRLAHPDATQACLCTAAVTRAIIEPVAERITVPAATRIRRSITATIACSIIESAAERITVPAAVTTTVANPITEAVTERITIPVGRAVVSVRVDNPDPVGCGFGQLLVDVAEQVEGLVVEQLGAVAVDRAGAQQAVGVVEVVEGGIDQLALVVGEIHDRG